MLHSAPLKPVAHYLLNTKLQTGTVSNKLVIIVEHLASQVPHISLFFVCKNNFLCSEPSTLHQCTGGLMEVLTLRVTEPRPVSQQVLSGQRKVSLCK